MATVYYTASTLDGMIAGPDHDLAWLEGRVSDPQGALGYERFVVGVGALVMGANTYQWVLDHHEGPWPYEIPAWVMTHRHLPPTPADVRFTAAPVEQVHAEAVTAAAGRDVWVVGGGDLAGQFHDAGLLDEVVVSLAPVTLGAGRPLLPRHVELALVELGRNGDFACVRYRVVR